MPDESAATTRFAAESWLRKNGLPLLVKPRHRATHLLGRAAPLLTIWFGLVLAYGLIALALSRAVADGNIAADFLLTDDSIDDTTALAMLIGVAIAALLLFTIPPLIIALINWGLGKLIGPGMGPRRWWGLTVVILNLTLAPWLLTLDGEVTQSVAFVIQISIVLGLLLVIATGIGSFLGWALRSALEQLSALRLMTSIALPLLILVVIFAFFSAEPWEMAASLAAGRMFWILVFLGATGLFFITYLAREELQSATLDLKDTESKKLLQGTPLAQIDPNETADIQRLNRFQRFNVWAVLVTAQVFQALFFGGIAFAFMLALAGLSLDPTVITSWSKSAANPMVILGFVLPIDVTTIRVCAFLAGIAALNFIVTTASNGEYRDAFYDPLMAKIRRALAVHAIYEHRLAHTTGKDDGDAQVIAEGIAALFTSGRAKRPVTRARKGTESAAREEPPRAENENVSGG